MLSHTENMAPGTVAMARPENAVAARLVARPEFCMPISMERAFVLGVENFSSIPRPKPQP